MNKLMIAGPGCGKTTEIIKRALSIKESKILITTFTIKCMEEIEERIVKEIGYLPKNIKIQTWLSMLLENGVRPYKAALKFENKIMKVRGIEFVEKRSGIRYESKSPVYWGDDSKNCYFNNESQIYSDKICKFTMKLDDETNGKVINRLADIYEYIFIDEIQDMTGYDLEFIKRLLYNEKCNVFMVGDPRQTIYKTHYDIKYKKYNQLGIDKFIKEICSNCDIDIDEESLTTCHRCHKDIVLFANKFYDEYEPLKSIDIEPKNHQGVFFIKEEQIEEYIDKYNPMQLIYSKKKETRGNTFKRTFGDAKGTEYSRVLLYPTEAFEKYLISGNNDINFKTKNKIYVAITRAIDSLTFVLNSDKNAFGLKNGLD